MQVNVLQARTAETARRLARLIRARLVLMDADLWRLVRDGMGDTATHAGPNTAMALVPRPPEQWSPR